MIGSEERASCGVGFVASLQGEASYEPMRQALHALRCVEHRGGYGSDRKTGDGSGIMADIPFALFDCEPGSVAIATLFLKAEPHTRSAVLSVLEQTFSFFDLNIRHLRTVPTRPEILGEHAIAGLPEILHAVIERPPQCRTAASFNTLLYHAKQTNRSKLREADLERTLHFTSLSTTTIVYKGLTRAEDLELFYPDLTNSEFKTRFAMFHRRFSTNTRTSWDKAQPFRIIAHNGEINSIAGNRSWSYSREQALGLRPDELLTHSYISDSGNLNEQVEALKYRSSMPHLEDVLAILIPPALQEGSYYEFWGRAMEPWDGPAFVTYADGNCVGARLDRNGFRPCRWMTTNDSFYLGSEAGIFDVSDGQVTGKGVLGASAGVRVELTTGSVEFRDPSRSHGNQLHPFTSRLQHLPEQRAEVSPASLHCQNFFCLTEEEVKRKLAPMIEHGIEPIGSMGDTASLAVLSNEFRSFYDFFFQTFAQVSNPPLDYLREKMVTDLTTHLGPRPNIFSPKELIPPPRCYTLPSPVLRLGQMQIVRDLEERSPIGAGIKTIVLDATFPVLTDSASGLEHQLEVLGDDAVDAVLGGKTIVILSQRRCNDERLPIPSLLALRAVVVALNREGLRLQTSVVVEAGDIRTTHQLAACIGFGATAVCPFVSLELARFAPPRLKSQLAPEVREQQLCQAYEQGLLKIMSKIGISVVRSYQSAKLFVPVGVGPSILNKYFNGLPNLIGGIELDFIEQQLRSIHAEATATSKEHLPSRYLLAEHARLKKGERHSMTAIGARLLHKSISSAESGHSEEYRGHLEHVANQEPVHLRDLLEFEANEPISIDEVQPIEEILSCFGAGAMSFGAISAESQRDIFIAMQQIGGRSNSGEGGENPYYFSNGLTAFTKQVASGRFGVTAEYLASAHEIEIKIAQGAKPGEGGQLMGVKVTETIARARFAKPGTSLISPAPLHDLYSIEDLKQLIYELKQFKPGVPICVKLVSGQNIGTIAAGVVKAGADVIQISGGDGGTGAAAISSMRHAGLPWEIGLCEVHTTLIDQDLRKYVTLRVDGGIVTGRDVIIAAIMGAEQFNFGKLLLIAQGCIMARICETNRCPTGIATHDPKFTSKYKGQPEQIVTLLKSIAGEIRETLASIGVASLQELLGKGEYLKESVRHQDVIDERGLNFSKLRNPTPKFHHSDTLLAEHGVSEFNRKVSADVMSVLSEQKTFSGEFNLRSIDRAPLVHLAGQIADQAVHHRSIARDAGDFAPKLYPAEGTIRLRLKGSAGQGAFAFCVPGMDIELFGEANDSVCKGMSGGRVVVRQPKGSTFQPETNAIIGNCALYGATAGTLFVHGIASDRFAVRNSGAIAVVEGVGMHACEYMTGGLVVILGDASWNIGSGMTGGVLYIPYSQREYLNHEYVEPAEWSKGDLKQVTDLLRDYKIATGSHSVPDGWLHSDGILDDLIRVVPRA